jgi:hypothetical protein
MYKLALTVIHFHLCSTFPMSPLNWSSQSGFCLQACQQKCRRWATTPVAHCRTKDRTSDTATWNEVAGAIVMYSWSRAAANLASCACCSPRLRERTLSYATGATAMFSPVQRGTQAISVCCARLGPPRERRSSVLTRRMPGPMMERRPGTSDRTIGCTAVVPPPT